MSAEERRSVNATWRIDWAEAHHHDVALSDEQGLIVARARINTGGRPVSGTSRPDREKSDPGDAAVLAGILRTDRHRHRPLPRISGQWLR
jgi:hypothetical protein